MFFVFVLTTTIRASQFPYSTELDLVHFLHLPDGILYLKQQYVLCQTEVEVSIQKFLESCVVLEGEDVRFECLVSHDEAPLALWKLQDVPLQNNEMNLIKAEGCAHSLTLRGVTKADSGTVTFSVGNYTSTASLTVRGKMNLSGNEENLHLFPIAAFIH